MIVEEIPDPILTQKCQLAIVIVFDDETNQLAQTIMSRRVEALGLDLRTVAFTMFDPEVIFTTPIELLAVLVKLSLQKSTAELYDSIEGLSDIQASIIVADRPGWRAINKAMIKQVKAVLQILPYKIRLCLGHQPMAVIQPADGKLLN